jgi:hypothetical protein
MEEMETTEMVVAVMIETMAAVIAKMVVMTEMMMVAETTYWRGCWFISSVPEVRVI